MWNLIIKNCKKLLEWYKNGQLWYMKMPEDENPGLDNMNLEEKLVYFTLPMSLNYQRNSYTLWEWVLQSYNDTAIKHIFSINNSAQLSEDKLRQSLLKYKIALQPNKHISTWSSISKTINENWGTIENLLIESNYDFLDLKDIVQKKYKKWFPYLSWPKIFNYWAYILWEYCDIELKNREYIEIAPDTHVKQCSIKLWVITEQEAENIKTEEISEKWRSILVWTWISPIDMHSPLWFWSRNSFEFKL